VHTRTRVQCGLRSGQLTVFFLEFGSLAVSLLETDAPSVAQIERINSYTDKINCYTERINRLIHTVDGINYQKD
jgi:hypothetical protein